MGLPLTDESVIPWINSKYAGKRMIDIPAEYLLWLYDNDKAHGDVGAYIVNNLDVLREQAKRNKK